MHPLVTASELAVLLERGEAVPADVRWYLDGRRGIDSFDAGHVPGAVFVDLDTALADPPSRERGRHPLPPPERFADAMSALGIGDDDLVVAYDDAGGAVASRLWWMLQVTGHRAAVLDGGIAAWNGPLETGPALIRGPARFTAREWSDDAIADSDDVARALDSASVTLVDARDVPRYRGEVEPIDARPGHIPGAKNAPWSGNLDDTGRFLPPPALRERYRMLGIDNATTDVVTYCGSGVTACHDLLALTLAGFDRLRLYVGSWSAWSGDPNRPAAVGDEDG